MATKINTTYYGAESDFISDGDYVKRSPYQLYNLIDNGTYTGGAFDLTAAPWGIGKSSISSNMTFVAAIGAEWTIHRNERHKGNTPLFLYYNSRTTEGAHTTGDFVGYDATPDNYMKAMYKCRTSPDVHNSSYNLISDLSVDLDSDVTVANALYNVPITYLNYQGARVRIANVYYKPVDENTIRKCSMTDIATNNVDVDKIVYFDIVFYDKTGTQRSVNASIGGSELEVADIYSLSYYGDNDVYVAPHRYVDKFGYWHIPYMESTIGFRNASSSTASYQSGWEESNNTPITTAEPCFNAWANALTVRQEFDDVSYHWEYGVTPYSSNQWEINPIETGDGYESISCRCYCYMDLDSEPDDKNAAYFSAIIHEVAFLGLPIITDFTAVSHDIGASDVYLPVFDDHMITTGEYKSGADSLTLPNAEWTDIFGTDMPDYDPTYEPEDDPDNQDDRGDLFNKGNKHYFVPASFNVYLMESNTFYQFISEITNYYDNLSPDDWTIDFQGVNPSDYIIGAYATQCWIPKSNTGSPIKLGKMSLNTSAYEFDRTKDGANLFSYGRREIKPFYNNFRDYAPYTTIELYLPLCGTIDLDTAYCMGHSITVDYCYDVLTMSCTAQVYRDGLLYKTADGSLGAQIPLLSANMGAYQNQLAQYDAAKKQNNMRLFGAAATITAGIATSIGSGGAAIVPAAVAIGGGIRSAVNAEMQNDLTDYQIDHLTPSLSQTGAADCQNGFSTGQLKPKLIIKRAKHLTTLNDDVYAHTVGNACCINNTIGSRHGLTVCSKIDTAGINATVEEIQAIKQAFANGVYV